MSLKHKNVYKKKVSHRKLKNKRTIVWSFLQKSVTPVKVRSKSTLQYCVASPRRNMKKNQRSQEKKIKII